VNICKEIVSLFGLLILVLAIPRHSNAQVSIKDSIENVWLIHIGYTYHLTAADMKARFGPSSNIHLGFGYKNKKNWIFGTEISYFFGNTINENNVLANLVNSYGYIIGEDGSPADIIIQERGLMARAYGGKLLSILGYNKNSGILFSTGVGFLQHKFRIDAKAGLVPSLVGDYKKGYDRLSNGMMITQFIGYHFMHNRKVVNFTIGIECIEGFTQSRRSLDYDTGFMDTKKRLDILWGPKIIWELPLYRNAEQKIYYR